MEIKENSGVINLTPHRVVVQSTTHPEDGWIFEPSGILPRLETVEVEAEDTWGIPTVSRKLGAVQNLPDPVQGVKLIVSSMILSACPDRNDLVAPDTGETAIRNNGRIEAVTRFVRN